MHLTYMELLLRKLQYMFRNLMYTRQRNMLTKVIILNWSVIDVIPETLGFVEPLLTFQNLNLKYVFLKLQYKWRSENSNALQNYVEITQPTLHLQNVNFIDAGKYFCDVFTSENQIVSSRAIDVKVQRKYSRQQMMFYGSFVFNKFMFCD